MRHFTAPVLALVALFLLAAGPASAVKRHDFKTCAQSGFCRRLRDLPPNSSSSPYSIDSSTLQYDSQTGWLNAEIKTSLYPEISFALDIGVTEQGLARVKVDEKHGLRQRYNETGRWALVREPSIATNTRFSLDKAGKVATLSWNTPHLVGSSQSARITLSPFKLEFLRDGEVQVSFNEQNLFHMEHFRVKKVGTDQQDPPEVAIDDGTKKARESFEPFMSEDGAWEEDFGGRKDTKPKGRLSLSEYLKAPCSY
jgi:alpha 1,3-glucosidase